jgi:hypothetical protein
MKTSLRLWQVAAALTALFLADFATAQTPARLDPPVKPTVNGKFTGNGKNAAIQFVTVEEEEPFSDKEAIALIFTEKDPAKVKKPSFDAVFGKLGSALILKVHHDGGIFGCQVAHSAHEKQGFTSLGQIKMEDLKIVGGNVTGHVTTGMELDTFGEKWEVDLTFAAPLPEKLRNAPATAAASKPAANEPMKKDEPKPAAGPLIAAHRRTEAAAAEGCDRCRIQGDRGSDPVFLRPAGRGGREGVCRESETAGLEGRPRKPDGKEQRHPQTHAGRCGTDDHGSAGSSRLCGQNVH